MRVRFRWDFCVILWLTPDSLSPHPNLPPQGGKGLKQNHHAIFLPTLSRHEPKIQFSRLFTVKPMSPKEIQALRRSLKLDQKELAHHLGVHPLTISQWETGFRSASPLALSALKLLKNFHQRHSPNSTTEDLLLHRFHFLNPKYFNPPLKARYDILINTRFKRTHGQCQPTKRKIKISQQLLQTGDWEKLDQTLKHEMLHAWLYEHNRPFGHTRQFKELLHLLQKNQPISSSSDTTLNTLEGFHIHRSTSSTAVGSLPQSPDGYASVPTPDTILPLPHRSPSVSPTH